MLLNVVLGFLCGGFALAAGNDPATQGPPPLLLVSFDGFRADYLKRFHMPNLELLYSQGVLVEQLTNVTGLYAESHGVLASSMYDPVSHKHFSLRNDSDPWWWSEAEPLWLTALDSGYETAAMMWPGSDVAIGNRTATHFLPYDAAVDDCVGLMVSELRRVGLWGKLNLVVTSDHGMAQCSAQRLIRLDDCLHPDNYTLVDLTPVAALIPNTEQKREDGNDHQQERDAPRLR
ncbi:unnamed protein product, partial [Menidia menidia]